MDDFFYIKRPKSSPLPIIVSVPHSGTEIPSEIRPRLDPQVASDLEDTDWFVHDLYSFASEIGATVIRSRFSRYVIDLNRDPSGRKLYSDTRTETSLVPLKTFGGIDLYKATPPTPREIEERIAKYSQPYHAALEKLLHDLRGSFRNVLLFDAHSIKRHVPSVRSEPFPDMILGDQLGKTASPKLTQAALQALQRGKTYNIAHNEPFMGGFITRHYGQKAPGIHALQLEMSQDIYMNQAEKTRNQSKEQSVATLLQSMLLSLAATLETLP